MRKAGRAIPKPFLRIFDSLANAAILKVGDYRLDCAEHLPGPDVVNSSTFFVFGRQRKSFYDNPIIIFNQSTLGEKRLCVGERLIWIICKDPLVKALRG